MKRAALFSTLIVTFASPLVLLSCATKSGPAPIGRLPDKNEFINGEVSTFMEKRCGSLDCHGQVGRPLRIYSDWGLRYRSENDGQRVKGPTTPEEKNENYYAVVGLEPDLLADSVLTGGAYVDFQLIKKPLDSSGGGINHKGGPVIRVGDGDPGWRCLHGWIRGEPSKDKCLEASKIAP
jgi:hypothetical protein